MALRNLSNSLSFPRPDPALAIKPETAAGNLRHGEAAVAQVAQERLADVLRPRFKPSDDSGKPRVFLKPLLLLRLEEPDLVLGGRPPALAAPIANHGLGQQLVAHSGEASNVDGDAFDRPEAVPAGRVLDVNRPGWCCR